MFTTTRLRRVPALFLGLTAVFGLTIAAAAPAFAIDGTVDPLFTTQIGTGADDIVRASAVQPDGDILIGGRFRHVDGVAVPEFARLDPDGTVDSAFEANLLTGFAGGDVESIALQPDGRILVAGGFTTYQGQINNGLVRLNADGTLDTAFMSAIGDGAHAGFVNTVIVEADGHILVGGQFFTFDAVPSPNLALLGSDGTTDPAFGANMGTGFDNQVLSLAQSPDGTILVGGAFDSLDGNPDWYFGRLAADGTPDIAYNAHFTFGDGQVFTIDPQADGSALVGGAFTNMQAVPENRLARINPDGSRDLTFDIGAGFDDSVWSIASLPDGSFLVGGAFTANDPVGSHLSRVESTGAVDQTFTTQLGASLDDIVYTVSVESSDSAIVGGAFTAQHLARIGTIPAATTPSTPTLAATGADSMPPLLVAIAALLAGAALTLLVARRARRTPSAAPAHRR